MALRRIALHTCILLLALAARGVAAEKPRSWVEVRSEHFVVASNAGEKQAREVAAQFEQVRAAFRQVLLLIRGNANPRITILAVKDEASLRDLLPEFWVTPQHVHPDGVFISGLHKNYIVLRTNAAGPNPYSSIYHEYFHALTIPYEPRLPLWLSEGLAVFYGNTRLAGREAELGRTDPALLAELHGAKLIPLEELFRVDKSSPEYNEKEKTTFFYAESWALTHYLLLGDGQAHRAQLEDYLSRVEKGAAPDQAAHLAFGDLAELENRLRDYVRGFSPTTIVKTAAASTERQYESRSLSAAETLALIGDSFVCRDRLQDAGPRLNEALRLDPENPLANEAMGLLYYQQHERDPAIRSLSRAIELDPDNFLTRFYRALLLQEQLTTPAENAEIESDLRRSIALNADFAPAYDGLAGFYSRQGQRLADALALAQKAIALEPGNISYQIDAGLLLLQMSRYDDARATGLRARDAARSRDGRGRVDAFLLTVEQSEEARTIENKLKEAQESAAAAAAAAQPAQSSVVAPAFGPVPELPAPPPNPGPAEATKASPPKLGPRASAEGKIIAVSCSGAEMRVKLKMWGYSLDLHSSNYARVLFLYQNWSLPDNFNPCRHLNGVYAEVKYAVVHRRDYGGEILSLEVLY